MGILIGIIQSFLNATGMILNKKVVENKKIGNNIQTLFSRGFHSIFLLILFGISFYILNIESLIYKVPSTEVTVFNTLLLIVATLGLYVTYPLRRTAYANEKISVLQPYAMLFQVFPVVLGFIFISTERANIITFLMALLASFIVMLSSFNLKSLEFNKYSMMVLLSSSIKSVQVFSTLYFLTILSPASFYFTESMIVITISIVLILIKKEYREIKLISKKYLRLLSTSNFIIIISIILSLTLYSTLGIVTTSLLSLLYLVFIYTLSYIFLKDIPKKKDIIVTILVASCVMIGLMFKV